MTDADKSTQHWRTKLLHPTVEAPQKFRALAPAVHRGSTVLFERLQDARDDWRGDGYSYGLYGTPTTRELALRVADLEGARASFVVPGGQAAIALVYLAFCQSGDHALLPESAHRPNRELADKFLSRLGVQVDAYDPLIGAGIAELIRSKHPAHLVLRECGGAMTCSITTRQARVHSSTSLLTFPTCPTIPAKRNLASS